MTQPAKFEGARTCPACGADALRVVRRMSEYVKGKRRVSYPDELTICDNCGESFYTREQMANRSIAITAALEEEEGDPFTPQRIRRILAGLQMKPADFERAVGLGEKTVARWERGTVPPSKAARFALWVAERFPAVIRAHAAALNGEEPQPLLAPLVATHQVASTATEKRGHVQRYHSQQIDSLTGKTGGQASTSQPLRGFRSNEA